MGRLVWYSQVQSLHKLYQDMSISCLRDMISNPLINMVASEWKSYHNAEKIQRIKLYWGTNPRHPKM